MLFFKIKFRVGYCVCVPTALCKIYLGVLSIVWMILRSGKWRWCSNDEGYEKWSHLFDQWHEIVDHERSGVQGVGRIRNHRQIEKTQRDQLIFGEKRFLWWVCLYPCSIHDTVVLFNIKSMCSCIKPYTGKAIIIETVSNGSRVNRELVNWIILFDICPEKMKTVCIKKDFLHEWGLRLSVDT